MLGTPFHFVKGGMFSVIDNLFIFVLFDIGVGQVLVVKC